MATPTTISANASAQYGKIKIGNLGSALKGVASVTSTTVTLDDATGLTGTSLYSTSRPGQLEIVQGVANGDKGKIANITGISGSVLTVSVDLTTALDDDSVVAVIPPLSVELFTNGGHSLEVTPNDDETMGLTETFLTHNTRLDATTAGSIPLFGAAASPGLGRMLAAGIGGYKTPSAGTHVYRPFQADDGSFAQSDDLTIYTVDGNGVHKQAWLANFVGTTTIDMPTNGIATASFDIQGAGVVREVGGSGKTYTSGSNNWDNVTTCDTSSRHTFNGAFLQLGGSFGDALDKDAADKFIQSLNIRIERSAIDDSVLGNQFHVKPVEDTHKLTITGTRILENNSFLDKMYGSGNAEPGQKTETRLLVKLVSVKDPTKTLTIDVPIVKLYSTVTRERGRFKESFTAQAIATLDSNGCIDTAYPLYECSYISGDASDYGSDL